MNKTLPHITAILILALAAGGLCAQSSRIKATAPVKNFRIPMFDRHNRLETFIQAETGTVISENQVDISDIRITQYRYEDEKASQHDPRDTSILTSPLASFFRAEKEIHGPSSFLFKRPDVEVSGEQWKYFDKEKKITIDKNTHVIFRAELPNLLK